MADDDFSVPEGRLVFLHSDGREPLSFIKGKAGASTLLLLTWNDKLSPIQNKTIVHKQESIKVKNLLSPLVSYNPFYPLEDACLSNYRRVVFAYGPDLQKRATTFSLELKHLLLVMGIQMLMRVELGRLFWGRILQFVDEEQVEIVSKFLLSNSPLVQYNPNILSSKQVMLDALAVPVSGSQKYHLDAICMSVMTADGVPLSIQYSHGMGYTSTKYLVQISSATITDFGLTWAGTSQTLREAIIHAHSDASPLGSNLNNTLVHNSILPNSEMVGGTCGLYGILPTTELEDYDTLFYWSLHFCHSMNKCGVPIVAGFLKTFSDRSIMFPQGPIIQSSLLNIAEKEGLSLSRPRPDQLVVALGEFHSWNTPNKPMLYSDSSFFINKVLLTLKLFKKLIPHPVISSYQRLPCVSPVANQLQALVETGGIIIFMSGLPAQLLKQIKKSDPTIFDHLEELLLQYFFHVYTNQLFVVVSNKTVTYKNEEVPVVDFLLRAAKACQCPAKIIGKTCT